MAASFYKRAVGYEYTETTYEKIDAMENLELTPGQAMAVERNILRIAPGFYQHLTPQMGLAILSGKPFGVLPAWYNFRN